MVYNIIIYIGVKLKLKSSIVSNCPFLPPPIEIFIFFHGFVFQNRVECIEKEKKHSKSLEFACRKYIKEKDRPGSEVPLLLLLFINYIHIHARTCVIVEEKYSY